MQIIGVHLQGEMVVIFMAVTILLRAFHRGHPLFPHFAPLWETIHSVIGDCH